MSANRIVKTPSGFEIYFPFHPAILEAVKNLPNRAFRANATPKHWYVPNVGEVAEDAIVKFATRYRFEMDFGNDRVAPGSTLQFDFSDLSVPEMPELTIPYSFRRTPFPFQLTGVAYALEKKRLIVGDQMGLGKTGQGIMAMTLANAFPLLIICPKTLVDNWKREVGLWTGKRAVILDKHIRGKWSLYIDRGIADVFICNFESLQNYFVTNIKQSEKFTINDITFNSKISKFKGVMVDESHRVKNLKTRTTKFVKGLAKDKEYIMLLSGTPVLNKPDDLIAQLGIIDQLGKFGGYKRFKDMYCERPSKAALMHLNAQLRRICFYRREKHEVLKDLPAKTRQVVYCDISTRKEYEEAQANLVEYMRLWKEKTTEEIEKSMRGEIMVRMGILKNISARGKLADACDFIGDVLDSGEKLVVFANLKDVINQVHGKFKHAVTITGDTPHDERQKNVDRFMNDPKCNLILCSIRAAGVGITLTSASRVAFLEFDWHPAIHDQAEDRCHRIGQTDNVQCTYFAGRDTIDEQIYELIEKKRDMTSHATGAVDTTEVSIVDDVLTLFHEKTTKPKEEPKDEFSAELFGIKSDTEV